MSINIITNIVIPMEEPNQIKRLLLFLQNNFTQPKDLFENTNHYKQTIMNDDYNIYFSHKNNGLHIKYNFGTIQIENIYIYKIIYWICQEFNILSEGQYYFYYNKEKTYLKDIYDHHKLSIININDEISKLKVLWRKEKISNILNK